MSGGMSTHLNPYAAAYAQNAMASAWNTYSMQTFQGLQRAGVTYGRSTQGYIEVRLGGLSLRKFYSDVLEPIRN